jgi:PAS domain S-box-containing protein
MSWPTSRTPGFLEETYQSGAWLDACYMVGWVLLGLAGFQQARSTSEARQAGGTPVPIRPVSFPPYLAVAAVYGILVIATEQQGSSLRVIVAGAIAVTGMVVARQVLTARENARLLAERASSRSAARFQAIIQNANDVIAVVDPFATIGYVTPSAARLFGQPVEGLAGLGLDTLLEPEDAPLALELLRTAATRSGAGDAIQCRVAAAGGGVRHVELSVTNLLDDAVVEGLVVTMRDVTERRQFEDQLREQAFHDPLTGLPNRALMEDRSSMHFAVPERRTTILSLLYLDIDDSSGSTTHSATRGRRSSVRSPVGSPVPSASGIRPHASAATSSLSSRKRRGRSTRPWLSPSASSPTCARRSTSEGRSSPSGPVSASSAPRSMDRIHGPPARRRHRDVRAKREALGGYRLFERAMFDATVERVSLRPTSAAALSPPVELAYQPLYDLSSRQLTGPRRCCAGTTRRAGKSCRCSSSRSRNGPARSSRSAAGSSSKRVGRSVAGT